MRKPPATHAKTLRGFSVFKETVVYHESDLERRVSKVLQLRKDVKAIQDSSRGATQPSGKVWTRKIRLTTSAEKASIKACGFGTKTGSNEFALTAKNTPRSTKIRITKPPHEARSKSRSISTFV